MGVHGTFCQLCGLPVQHDHYVPAGGMFAIYRGDRPHGGHDWEPGDDPFRFGPEHAWLERGVALRHDREQPSVLHGEVQDGVLEDATTHVRVMVFEGDDDARTFHAHCWRALGSPTEAARAPVGVGAFAWGTIAPYHAQLFGVRELAHDGKAWMLDDPETSPRSRARIDALVADARRLFEVRAVKAPRTVADVLALDRGWDGRRFEDDAHDRRELLRYRADIERSLDLAGYTTMICVIKEYPPDLHNDPTPEVREAFEAFELRLKAAVETDGEAIFVASTFGGKSSQGQYYIYTKHEAATLARIGMLPGLDEARPHELSIEPDPAWTIFFTEVVAAASR